MSKTHKMTTQKSIIAPADCNEDQLMEIESLHEVGDFSILTDSFKVWIGEQKRGESPTQNVEIPRHVFNKLARWYLAPQHRQAPIG